MPDLTRLIDRMRRTPHAVAALARGLDDHDARWKPPSGAWSIVEIVCHLADEEAEDFRPRLERTLRDPREPWDPIDPERAARDRRYIEQPLDQAIARFERERQASLAWLAGLEGPPWGRAHTAKFGVLSAGDLLASWAAHDALHLRQIAKRLHELAARDAPGFSTAYAGPWGA